MVYPPWCKTAYSGETVWLFFSSTKKMASPKRSLLTQIWFEICRTLYPPNDNPRAYLPLIWSKMLILFDHQQYIEADKRQLRSKVPVIISFIGTNTWNIRLFQKPVGNMASKSFPETSIEIASFCPDFNARDILNSERHLIIIIIIILKIYSAQIP